VDLARGRERAQLHDALQRTGLASEHQAPARHHALRIAAGLQRGEVRRGDLQDIDAFAREVLAQQPLVLGPLARDDVHKRSATPST
jgi:hypothetical protein